MTDDKVKKNMMLPMLHQQSEESELLSCNRCIGKALMDKLKEMCMYSMYHYSMMERVFEKCLDFCWMSIAWPLVAYCIYMSGLFCWMLRTRWRIAWHSLSLLILMVWMKWIIRVLLARYFYRFNVESVVFQSATSLMIITLLYTLFIYDYELNCVDTDG